MLSVPATDGFSIGWVVPEPVDILFGLASAVSWGAGDFCGGLAARRSRVYSVVIVSQVVGFFLLIGLALLLQEPIPVSGELLWGSAAGLAGGLGLVALYRGLAVGRMGIVAPVSAVVSVAVPTLFGLFSEGLPASAKLPGFGLALVAVWLTTRSDGPQVNDLRELGFPFLAGIGFGVFLVLIGRVSEQTILWPLTAARAASIVMLLLVAALARQSARPAPGQLPVVALVGALDTAGNAFYALAARAGRLDTAAVLSSLAPAGTVLLARFFLEERFGRWQWLGVAFALIAVVLISW